MKCKWNTERMSHFHQVSQHWVSWNCQKLWYHHRGKTRSACQATALDKPPPPLSPAFIPQNVTDTCTILWQNLSTRGDLQKNMEKPLKIRRQKQALYTLHEAHIYVLLAAQKLVPSATHGRDNVKWDMKFWSGTKLGTLDIYQSS